MRKNLYTLRVGKVTHSGEIDLNEYFRKLIIKELEKEQRRELEERLNDIRHSD